MSEDFQPLAGTPEKLQSVELLWVAHLRPMSREPIHRHFENLQDETGRLEKVLSETVEWWAYSHPEVADHETSVGFNELEGDGPHSHFVLDVLITCTDASDACAAALVTACIESLGSMLQVASTQFELELLAKEIRKTKRMTRLEQSVRPLA